MSTRICLLLVLSLIPNYILAQSLEELKKIANYGSGLQQCAAEYSIGLRYLKDTEEATKDPAKAYSWFKRSANHGYALGCYALGWCHKYGNGTFIDIDRAVIWYEKAAESYNADAAFELSKLYIYGDEINKNVYKGIKYAKIAAFGGMPEGKYLYALCFAKGFGTQKDSIKAKIWAFRAIDDKCYTSYWLLGNMYYSGSCVDKDYSLAMHYYLLGDEKNESNCQYSLGKMYEDGKCQAIDMDKAVEFYSKAANGGNKDASIRLAVIYSDTSSNYYNLNKAISLLEKIVYDGFYRGGSLLMELYYSSSQINKANNLYSKMMSKSDAKSLNQLAYFFANNKSISSNFTKAQSVIDRAIEIAPYNCNFLDTKGELYLIEGQESKAEKIWEKILKIKPSFFNNIEEGYKESVLNKHFSSKT